MKLIKFDKTNCAATTRKGENAITVRRCGTISLNIGCLRLTKLKAGDSIAILQDEQNPEDWYIAKDPDGFTLRNGSKASKCLIANNSSFVNKMLDALGIHTESGVRFQLAPQPTKEGNMILHGIITSKPIIHNKRSKQK
jgi:hypothetical protein